MVFNCLGDVKPESITIPALLVRQVQSSVYMEDSIRHLAAMGLGALVEIGPGKVLSGFVRKTVPELPVYTVETAAELDKLTETVKGEACMNFSGKTAIVTGGSRGLGRAICLELAKGGANVVFCYAGNETAAQETACGL